MINRIIPIRRPKHQAFGKANGIQNIQRPPINLFQNTSAKNDETLNLEAMASAIKDAQKDDIILQEQKNK